MFIEVNMWSSAYTDWKIQRFRWDFTFIVNVSDDIYGRTSGRKYFEYFRCRPNKNEVDSEYLDAMAAGNYGVDCGKMYQRCLPGHGILDSISFLK